MRVCSFCINVDFVFIAANDRGMWVSYQDLHHGDFLRNLKIMKLDGVSIEAILLSSYFIYG